MQANLSCWQIKEMISLYIDNELPENDKFLVKKHLLECRECFDYYQSLLVLSRKIQETSQCPPIDISEETIKDFDKLHLCRKVSDNLSAYIDRELSKEEMIEISEHLLVCKYCRKDYENLKQISQLIKDYLNSSENLSSTNPENIVEKTIRIRRRTFYKVAVATIFAFIMFSWISVVKIEPIIKKAINSESEKENNSTIFVKAEDYMFTKNFFDTSQGALAFVYDVF